MRRLPLVAAAIALAAALIVICVVQFSGSSVAATVNGQAIYESDVTAYVEQYRSYAGLEDDDEWADYLASNEISAEDMREAAITSLAQQALFEQAAADQGLEITSEALASAVQSAKNSLGYGEMTDETWEAYKNMYGYTDESFENQVYLTLLQETLCEANVEEAALGSDEIFEYVQENASLIAGKESAYLSSSNYQFIYYAIQYLKTLEVDEVRDAMQMLANAASGEASIEDETMQGLLDYLADDTVIFESGWDCAEGWADWYQLVIDEMEAHTFLGDIQADDSDAVYYAIVVLDTYDGALSYASLEDAKEQIPATLYDSVVTFAESDAWQTSCNEYLESLLETMDLNIKSMPEGLSYDV